MIEKNIILTLMDQIGRTENTKANIKYVNSNVWNEEAWGFIKKPTIKINCIAIKLLQKRKPLKLNK